MNKKEENSLIERYKKEFDRDVKQGNYAAAYAEFLALAVLLIQEEERPLSPTYNITLQRIIKKIVKNFVGFNFITFWKLFEEVTIYEVHKWIYRK
jgi:hypothetical protein